MNENKFRTWDEKNKTFWYSTDEAYVLKHINGKVGLYEDCNFYRETTTTDYVLISEDLEQYIRVNDKNGNEYYIGDKGKFDNGDTFILKMEDHLEVYCEWIGDPECEDQTRDLYRISSAEIIGHIHKGE